MNTSLRYFYYVTILVMYGQLVIYINPPKLN